MFNLKNFLKKYNLFMLFLIVIILWGFFGAITGGGFLSSRNISNLFRQMSITGILSIGMSFVIITANIDLSVGSMLGLLGGIVGILLRTGLNSTLTIIITLIFGFIIGAINGFWVAYRKVPAFIVTLAGLLAYRGVVLYITKGQTLAVNNSNFNFIGNGNIPPLAAWGLLLIFICCYSLLKIRKIIKNKNLQERKAQIINLILTIAISFLFVFWMNGYRGIPLPVIVMLVITFIASYVSDNTVYGRIVYSIGGNAEACKYSGINIKKYIFLVFTVNGIIAAFAGIINTARLASAVPSTGLNSELDAIASCVIGGISLSGGTGAILGALLGSLIIASLNNGMSIIGLDSSWQNIIKGIVLLLAVWMDIATKNKSN